MKSKCRFFCKTESMRTLVLSVQVLYFFLELSDIWGRAGPGHVLPPVKGEY